MFLKHICNKKKYNSKMWSMDYVQVPEERDEGIEETKVQAVEESKEVIKEKKKAELVKQMSLSTDGGGR